MIKLGTAGTSGLGYEEGLKHCKELGLNALEVEFTYGVRLSNKEAKRIGAMAKKLGISLSVHAPYYINLNSEDKTKIIASKKRIINACERAHYLEAKYVVFHAAFYGKKTKEKCYSAVKKEIIDLQKKIKKKKFNVVLAPETTGKISQFGTVDELLKLVKETKCSFCIDFAHIFARNQGKIDYDSLFDKLKKFKHLHCHFSGINYTSKGERSHKITKEKDLKPLLSKIKKKGFDVTIVNESPDPFGDSVKARNILSKL